MMMMMMMMMNNSVLTCRLNGTSVIIIIIIIIILSSWRPRGLSPRRARFNPRPVHEKYERGSEMGFPPSIIHSLIQQAIHSVRLFITDVGSSHQSALREKKCTHTSR
jgi:hypothetical protein